MIGTRERERETTKRDSKLKKEEIVFVKMRFMLSGEYFFLIEVKNQI